MPAESAPHERTVMCWPARAEVYGDLIEQAEEAHAQVAKAIATHEPVSMIAAPGSGARAARLCGTAVDIVEIPIDDSWFRDTGPIYVIDEGAGSSPRLALDWEFNGWGGKFSPWNQDALVARRWAEHAGHEVRRVPMVLEGGSLTVDGEGTLVTTTQCLMHPNRNPALSKAEIERGVREHLGVDTIVWLPYGLSGDDDTDGHADNVAAFARPGLLVMQGCDDANEPDWLRMNVNARWARGSTDTSGRLLDVIEIPVLPFVEIGGGRRAVPYANFYVGNGFVLVPTADNPADADMLGIIAAQFPGREVIGLNVGPILAHGGGGIHCITQQVPALST